MLKLDRSQPSEDAAKADLDDMDARLARLLMPLLIGRFHPEVLRLWAYLRCCIASALEGDYMASLETTHVAVEGLAAVVERRFGHAGWITDPHSGGGAPYSG
jgi:hypothetical protein